jgi:hypothetical protein
MKRFAKALSIAASTRCWPKFADADIGWASNVESRSHHPTALSRSGPALLFFWYSPNRVTLFGPVAASATQVSDQLRSHLGIRSRNAIGKPFGGPHLCQLLGYRDIDQLIHRDPSKSDMDSTSQI